MEAEAIQKLREWGKALLEDEATSDAYLKCPADDEAEGLKRFMDGLAAERSAHEAVKVLAIKLAQEVE